MASASASDLANPLTKTHTDRKDTQPVQNRCAHSQDLSPQYAPEAIAIIGFSAKLPGDATSSESFWRMMEEGRSAMSEVPKDRFNIDSFYHPNVNRLDTVSIHGSYRMLSGYLRAITATCERRPLLGRRPRGL